MARREDLIEKPKKCNAKQMRAIDAYMLNGRKKTPAMIAAGYKAKSAKGNCFLFFSKPEVKEEIRRREELMEIKYELTEDWVIQRFMKIADSGNILAKFKKINDKGQLYWDFEGATEADLSVISGMTNEVYLEGRGDDAVPVKKFKIETESAKGALDSLARKLGLFNDKVQVTGELSLVERLQRGRERARARNAPETEVSRDTKTEK